MSQLTTTTAAQPPNSSLRPEKRRQNMSLRWRLTLLILAITVPVLIAVGAIVTTIAGNNLEEAANTQLANINRTLASNVSTWLDLNTKALKQLVLEPDIISMQAEQQQPSLVAMATAYPDMYLISTTDLTGQNVARSDGIAPKDYSGREWFQGARAGDLTFQTLIGATSGKPALVAAAPIKRSDVIVGVGMFASELTTIRNEVNASRIGQSGNVYVIDDKNNAVAFTDLTLPITQVNQLDSFSQVSALRQGTRGQYDFTDKYGIAQRAYLDVLPNGWGIIVQQSLDELFSSSRDFRQLASAIVVFGLILLAALAWFIIRRALRPINTLTETVTAITGGDLSRAAPVEREDEIGLLARAFNTMTGRLRELIDSLETRVEMRTAQVQASADVGRAATSILNTDQLLKQVATLITERFGFYYAGVFVADKTGKWAVLHEASGPADAAWVLKQSGHKLEIGGKSMVGNAIVTRAPQIALDVGAAPVRFANPLLPDTRSEIALPLIVGTRVLGALDVQSIQPAAFDPTSAVVLQTMADQIAIALHNAGQYQREQARAEQTTSLLAAILELSSQPDEITLFEHIEQVTSALLTADGVGLWFSGGDDWLTLRHTINVGDVSLAGRQLPIGEGLAGKVYGSGLTLRVDNYQAWEGQSSAFEDAPFDSALGVPLRWQNQTIGVLTITRSQPNQPFTLEDENLAQLLAAQATAALENIWLRAEQQQALADLDALNRRLTGETWQKQAHKQTLTYERRSTTQAMQSPGLSFQIPIELRGVPIGTITLEDEQRRAFTDEERALINGVTQQLALALENQRLADSAQSAAQRDRAIAETADKIHRPTNLDAILHVAVDELSRITGISGVGVQLGFAPDSLISHNGNHGRESST